MYISSHVIYLFVVVNEVGIRIGVVRLGVKKVLLLMMRNGAGSG